MKIVSLLPSATEILFALGLGDHVVGVTFECDYPSEAKTKTIVSTSALPEGLSPAEIDAVVKERIAAGEDLYRLDQSALADIDPDLIITQDLCAVCAIDVNDVDEALSFLGCSADVVTLDPKTLSEVIESIATVGKATGTEAEAETLIADLDVRLGAVALHLADIETADRPNVMLVEWVDPIFTGGHWVPDMIGAAGGDSVLGFPGTHSEGVELDAVHGSEADIVIVAPCGFGLDGSAQQAEDLYQRNVLPPRAEVWAIDANSFIVRPGPRLVHGVEILASVFHPEADGRYTTEQLSLAVRRLH